MSEKRYKISNGDGGTFPTHEDKVWNTISGEHISTMLEIFGVPEKVNSSDHQLEWSVEIYDTVNEEYLDCIIMDKRWSDTPIGSQTKWTFHSRPKKAMATDDAIQEIIKNYKQK
jgi:hypothetical protein